MTHSATEAVLALIDQLPAPPDDDIGSFLTKLREELDGPIRIAVVGRIKGGKSTLVNALLGQKIAATDAGECTQIPTVFKFGFPEKAELLYGDGTAEELPVTFGPLGGDLPEVRESKPVALYVTLSNDLLRKFTIVDTPGFGSVRVDVSGRTWDYLLPTNGNDALIADAIIFVISGEVLQEELNALTALNVQYSTELGMAVSTFGALTKVDLIGDIGGDLRLEAEERSALLRSQLSQFVTDVFPVLGLLAETATSGSLTEPDGAAVARLAELTDSEIANLLMSVDRFRNHADCIEESSRHRLLELLGLRGIDLAVQSCRSGHRGAAALTKMLLEESWIEPLLQRLASLLSDNADVLRVSRALRVLRDLSYSQASNDDSRKYYSELRNRVEVLRSSTQMHVLDEREAYHSLVRGLVELSDPWHERALRITRSGPIADIFADPDSEPLEIFARISQTIDEWRSFSYSCRDADQGRVADIVIRSLEIEQHGMRSITKE
jgi:GTP-binding protein EngB required for normal cell division